MRPYASGGCVKPSLGVVLMGNVEFGFAFLRFCGYDLGEAMNCNEGNEVKMKMSLDNTYPRVAPTVREMALKP